MSAMNLSRGKKFNLLAAEMKENAMLLFEFSGAFVKAVRAVFASAFAAIAAFVVVHFCEHNVAIRAHVIVFGIEFRSTSTGCHGIKHTSILVVF